MIDRPSINCVLLVVLCCTLFCNLRPGLADEIHLKNGDRLSGKVISVARGSLRLATDYAGDLTLRWDAVAALRSDRPVVITLRSGRRLIGWLESDGGKDSFFLSDAGRLSVQPAEIASLRPLTENERQQTGVVDKPALWKQRLEAGAQVRSGNTDSTDVMVGYRAQRQSGKSELAVDLNATYGETDGERTAQRAQAEARLDRFHSERFFSFYLLALEHDALEDLDLRAQQQAGIGYKFILTPRTLVQGEIGSGVREELFENGEWEIAPIGRIGGKWSQKIGTASKLEVRAAFLPDLIDLGTYRMEGEAALNTPLTNHFSLRFSLLDSFDSNPQPGIEKNDLTLLSSIVWSF